MTAQAEKSPQVRTVVTGQAVLVDVVVRPSTIREAGWVPVDGHEGVPRAPLEVQVVLTADDLRPWLEQQVCSWNCCIDRSPGPYEQLLESVVQELHQAAHNGPGDCYRASDCRRYPCRRLSEES